MKLTEQFLAELDREVPKTRRTIERVPQGKDDWKPHPKSMELKRLASTVAGMPGWISLIIDQDELDLTPPPGQGQQQQAAKKTLLQQLDEGTAKGRESLKKTNDQYLLTTNWRLKAGGHVVMTQPRHIVIRDTINHLAHHRGQLTVYLRMLDVPVPAIYGPSADDQTFA